MNKKSILNEINNSTKKIINLIKPIHYELINFRPLINDAWTIKEHIVHIVDSECNVFLRLKTIIAEPKKKTFLINELKWTNAFEIQNEMIEDLIKLFTQIRKVEMQYLSMIDIDKYSENYIIHKDLGKLTLETWLKWYTSYHINEHIKYIRRNINIYNKTKGEK